MHERRLTPRYSVEWPVTLHWQDSETFEVRACDISVTGIGLMVPRNAVVALAQGGSILTPGDRLQVGLAGAADSGAHDRVTLEGRVRHVRRLAHERYQLGIWFADCTPPQQAALDALVEQARAGWPQG